MNDAIKLIESQQEKLKEGTAAWAVGEQLKDICRREPESADLIEKDISADGMGLAELEKEIKKYADQHRKGNFSFVSPQAAEDIIRKFYGLPAAGAETTRPESSGAGSNIIDLMDLL